MCSVLYNRETETASRLYLLYVRMVSKIRTDQFLFECNEIFSIKSNYISQKITNIEQYVCT